VKVDDAYLYESIKESNKRIVKGYKPAMPSFAHLKDDQVKALIAYIKSLKDEKPVHGRRVVLDLFVPSAKNTQRDTVVCCSACANCVLNRLASLLAYP